MKDFSELVEYLEEQRGKEDWSAFWNAIIDNSNLIFWECQVHNKTIVAEALKLTQPVFSTVYKIVVARASK